MYVCFGFEENEAHFIFPTTKGSMNTRVSIVELSTSNKVNNHCLIGTSKVPSIGENRSEAIKKSKIF